MKSSTKIGKSNIYIYIYIYIYMVICSYNTYKKYSKFHKGLPINMVTGNEKSIFKLNFTTLISNRKCVYFSTFYVELAGKDVNGHQFKQILT